MTQEVIKNMLSKLDTMLEFDEGIAVTKENNPYKE